MIPASIDYKAIVLELNSWGIGDYKIELICGLAKSAVAHLKDNNDRDMTYQRAARLYNFWWDERTARGLNAFSVIAPVFENNQSLVETT
jgi:hypothetical protein